jgi:hypothetical protein
VSTELHGAYFTEFACRIEALSRASAAKPKSPSVHGRSGPATMTGTPTPRLWGFIFQGPLTLYHPVGTAAERGGDARFWPTMHLRVAKSKRPPRPCPCLLADSLATRHRGKELHIRFEKETTGGRRRTTPVSDTSCQSVSMKRYLPQPLTDPQLNQFWCAPSECPPRDPS